MKSFTCRGQWPTARRSLCWRITGCSNPRDLWDNMIKTGTRCLHMRRSVWWWRTYNFSCVLTFFRWNFCGTIQKPSLRKVQLKYRTNEPTESQSRDKYQNGNKWDLPKKWLFPCFNPNTPQNLIQVPSWLKTNLRKMLDYERWSYFHRVQQCCWYLALQLEVGILLSCMYTHSVCEHLWCSSIPWNT